MGIDKHKKGRRPAINGPTVDTGDKAVIISEGGVADADKSVFIGTTVHVVADIDITGTISYDGPACGTHNHIAKAGGGTSPGSGTDKDVVIGPGEKVARSPTY